MNESPQTLAPPGWHAITPRLVVRGADALVAFLVDVFGATGCYQETAPSIITIGDSKLMISEAGPRDARGAFLYVYVGDVDDAYHRALQHGARSIEQPFATPYGDRRCMIEDRWGNAWQIATPGRIAR